MALTKPELSEASPALHLSRSRSSDSGFQRILWIAGFWEASDPRWLQRRAVSKRSGELSAARLTCESACTRGEISRKIANHVIVTRRSVWQYPRAGDGDDSVQYFAYGHVPHSFGVPHCLLARGITMKGSALFSRAPKSPIVSRCGTRACWNT